MEHSVRDREHLIVIQIAQVFPVSESTSGRVAALAGLASQGEGFQGERGWWESCGARRERELRGQAARAPGGNQAQKQLLQETRKYFGGQLESRKSKAVHSHAQRNFPEAWSAVGSWNHWERK